MRECVAGVLCLLCVCAFVCVCVCVHVRVFLVCKREYCGCVHLYLSPYIFESYMQLMQT